MKQSDRRDSKKTGSERLLRTFLAVDLPDKVKETALFLQTTVIAKPKVIKWIKAMNTHLTIRSIGPTPEEEVRRIQEAVAEAIVGHQDIPLEVRGTGVFPRKERPRIFWMGVGGEVKQLQKLVKDINVSLDKLGYPAEPRLYTPHITIGRMRYPQKITPDVSHFLNSEYDPIEFEVQKVKFIQSDLVPGGPIYSLLGIHELTPITQEKT